MAELACRVDYLRATTLDQHAILDAAKGYFSNETATPSIPLYGYKHSIKHNSSGAIYLFGGHTPTMGNCQQFSGMAITSLMEAFGQASVPALHYVCDDRWKVTRLDIAIDCFDPELRPRHFYAALDRGDCKSIFRSWREIANKDLDVGHTVYGGGAESEKQLRVYDKSAEQGQEGIWTRYEMVFNGKRAQEVWDMVKGLQSDAQLLTEALRLLDSMVSFGKWDKWRDTFHPSSTAVWREVPRTQSKTWEWLMRQVAPAFRNQFDKDGDWRLLDEFVEAVKRG